jgi:hypothetical protein
MVFSILAQAACWAFTLAARVSGRAGCTCYGEPAAFTNQGLVTGFGDETGSSVFLGIPYAASTEGQNR